MRRDGSNRSWFLPLLIGSIFLVHPIDAQVAAIGGAPLGDAVLYNGQILSVDSSSNIWGAVRVQNDTITAVGSTVASLGPLAATTKLIDLAGRTVVPGLIDSHVHFMRDSQAPGYRIHGVETAFSIPDLLSTIQQRAQEVPPGSLLTLVGGIRAKQFVENRLPTLAELDSVAPNNLVYLHVSFSGPAVTNSLGQTFFQNNGVSVGATGSIIGSATQSLQALVQNQSTMDAERAFLDYVAYANSVGLTTVLNYGGCGFSGVNVSPPVCEDIPYALWQQGALNMRLRMAIGGLGPTQGGIYPIVPNMQAALQTLASFGGADAILDIVRAGEFVVGGFGSTTAPFATAFGQVAAQGWALAQHSNSTAEHEAHVTAFETVNLTTPIAVLRWSLDHVFQISNNQLSRLLSIGAGVTVQSQQYFLSNGGPPYSTIVNSGVQVGAGTDGTAISPLTPWASIYYMVTGKDVAGALVNGGQQLTRMEALRLYTTGSAWYTFDDTRLGSIEVGKLADFVVLSDDYLTVTDNDIRTLSSIMTVVDGHIVHVEPDAFPVQGCGFNPPGSLVSISGAPAIGTTWTLGVDNPLGTQPSGSEAYLFVALAADPAFPCGTRIPGFGMSSPGAIGELLVDLAQPYFVLGPVTWSGAGTPAPFPIAIPALPGLLGFEAHLQGVILDTSGVSGIPGGLTVALGFQVF